MKRICLPLVGALVLAGSAASAQPAAPDFKALLTPAVMKDLRQWIDTDVVRVSIEAQNKRLANPDQAQIDALDKEWVKERKAADKPLISATLSNPLSIYLTRMQGRSLGLYAEIFVMDHSGLNVGQSSITSDFWQGDEAKYQKTFAVGKDAVFVDKPEWDDDNKIWRGQVSFTITDKSGATEIGAASVDINLTELQRRSSLGM